jgi:hypothetical protein
MDFKPIKSTDALSNTKANRNHVARPQRTKQPINSNTLFRELLTDLMMEQREQQ